MGCELQQTTMQLWTSICKCCSKQKSSHNAPLAFPVKMKKYMTILHWNTQCCQTFTHVKYCISTLISYNVTTILNQVCLVTVGSAMSFFRHYTSSLTQAELSTRLYLCRKNDPECTGSLMTKICFWCQAYGCIMHTKMDLEGVRKTVTPCKSLGSKLYLRCLIVRHGLTYSSYNA